MPLGKELLQDIDSARPENGLCFWWLGQQSYAVKAGGKVMYFDPFLSPHPRRQVQPPFAPEMLNNADFIFGTHDHRDHIDREALPAIMRASPQALLFVPIKAAGKFADSDIPRERIVSMNDETVWQGDGVRVTAIKAAHEFFDFDPVTGYPYLQYVVEAGGSVIYHAGDTLRYEGMVTRLQSWRHTVAFLPINGRDAERYSKNTIGNLTFQEAADVAGELAPKLAVPGHWDMFATNGEDPARFAAYYAAKYPGLACRVPVHGERVCVAV